MLAPVLVWLSRERRQADIRRITDRQARASGRPQHTNPARGIEKAVEDARDRTGLGVPHDYAEAARLYRKAAEQGNALAQSELGVVYFNGRGVPQDYVLAYMWLNLAAAQGSQDVPEGYDASSRRGHVAKFMTREQIAEAQRLAREWRPK